MMYAPMSIMYKKKNSSLLLSICILSNLIRLPPYFLLFLTFKPFYEKSPLALGEKAYDEASCDWPVLMFLNKARKYYYFHI